MNTILEGYDITYSYDGDTPAIDHLNFAIKRGEKIACIGSNGSGKSTFFLNLIGILKPDSGKILIDEAPISYSKKGLLTLRQKIGIVFQDSESQLFSPTVFQEIAFGLSNLGLSPDKVREETTLTLEKLKLSELAGKPVHALSGGQKKQVAFASVLAMKPSILLLDEPASSLDPQYTVLIRNLVQELTDQGITVIASTHDMDYAFSWADRIFLFHNGRLLAQAPPETVFQDKPLLKTAHLKQPVCLEFYNFLVEQNVLPKHSYVPHTMDGIRKYFKEKTNGESNAN